jgi:hypothetical protein
MHPSRRCLIVAALALAAPLAAEAGSPRDGKPDWISGESLEWPRQLYLTGVGVGDDRATAQDRARAEVSRIFKTRVVATTSAFAAETSRASGDALESASTRATSDDTRTVTERDLVGVEIAATWQDPASRQVYALAVLERRQAAARLESQLEAIDAAVRPLAPAVRAEDRVAAGLAALRYRALARRREPILEDLHVIAPGRTPAVASLDAEARAALGRLVVSLQTRNTPDGLRTGVTRGLAAAGLVVRPADDSAPDLTVAVDSAGEDLGKRDGWSWARVTATVSLREAGTNRVLLELSDSERQAATAPGEASARAVKALAARLERRIPAELDLGSPADR